MDAPECTPCSNSEETENRKSNRIENDISYVSLCVYGQLVMKQRISLCNFIWLCSKAKTFVHPPESGFMNPQLGFK